MPTTIERATRPPVESIMRVSPFAVRSATDGAGDGEEGDGLTLDGFAAVFGQETIIDSWEGRFKEVLVSGCMRKTFREVTPKLQFDHGTHPMIGSIPIGVVQVAEEASDPALAPDGGAHVVARLFDNWLTAPVRDAIVDDAINGMSFRFSVVREEWRDKDGKIIRDDDLDAVLFASWFNDIPDDELLTRSLKEVKVRELGPVVWPAYEGTSVSVRSRLTIDMAAVRAGDEFERRKLADALFAADAANGNDNDSRAVTVRESTINTGQDAPDVTADAAEVHAGTSTGTPEPTAPSAAGDHESSTTRGTRPIDQWVRHARQTVRKCS